jgi:hypothetical protein
MLFFMVITSNVDVLIFGLDSSLNPQPDGLNEAAPGQGWTGFGGIVFKIIPVDSAFDSQSIRELSDASHRLTCATDACHCRSRRHA